MSMRLIPYGVKCKTPNCDTSIILGKMWIPRSQRRLGEGIEFVGLKSRPQECQVCGRSYEYAQADLLVFAECSSLFV